MFEKAKAVIIERPRHAKIDEVRLPEVDDESVVIRTLYSAISTGTEVKIWNGTTGKLGGKLWYPLIPGYEQTGIVEYVGPKAKKTAAGEALKEGDRVMSNEVRCYPDYCAAWGGQVGISVKNPTTSGAVFDMPAKIPDGVSFQQATVAYLAGVALKGVEKTNITEGETAVVVGVGAVGLSAVQLAKMAGATVIIIEKSRWRLERAKKFADFAYCANGASPEATEAIAGFTDGRMADVVIEASGDSRVVNNIRTFIRQGGWERGDDGGRIHLQGDYPQPICLTVYEEWFNRNLTISTSCALRAGDKEAILKLISEGKFDADILFDKEISLEQAPAEYAELEHDLATRMKTVIKWS
ncbi:MAG TPA: zinc-binding dehydrogenase [Phycisphaerales bacterium]|nr:zinc-binding dehydrogenase [Phycisphaerales bacterium]